MRDSADHMPLSATACLLVALCLVPSLGWAQDGALIADDSELFSNGLLTEF